MASDDIDVLSSKNLNTIKLGYSSPMAAKLQLETADRNPEQVHRTDTDDSAQTLSADEASKVVKSQATTSSDISRAH